jgi:hypothetical protein
MPEITESRIGGNPFLCVAVAERVAPSADPQIGYSPERAALRDDNANGPLISDNIAGGAISAATRVEDACRNGDHPPEPSSPEQGGQGDCQWTNRSRCRGELVLQATNSPRRCSPACATTPLQRSCQPVVRTHPRGPTPPGAQRQIRRGEISCLTALAGPSPSQQ